MIIELTFVGGTKKRVALLARSRGEKSEKGVLLSSPLIPFLRLPLTQLYVFEGRRQPRRKRLGD